MRIHGTLAAVVGGASGLGAATAVHLAERGARVIVLDRNEDAAREIADRVGGAAYGCDIVDADGMAAVVDLVCAEHGVPRMVSICAGVGISNLVLGKSGTMPLGDFAHVVNVDLLGTFNVIRLFAAKMADAEPMEDDERGVFVTTASVAAQDGQIGQAAYSVAKGGVLAMTLPLAREFARFGIRVLCLSPGVFETPLLKNVSEEKAEELRSRIPFPRRFGKPSEYAALVAHCCENTHLNGEHIRIDGAIRLQPR